MLSDILLRAGKIGPEQAKAIKLMRDVQRMKILKVQGDHLRGREHLEDEVSAVEVAVSLAPEVPGESDTKFTEAAALHAGMPFTKIDPVTGEKI